MSSFGEIVEPGTRTAWEDWDENIQDESQPKLVWYNDVAVPMEINTFFILEGKYIAESVIAITKNKLELVNVIQPLNINLYRSENSNVYICVLRDYNLLLSSEIVELLKLYITVSNDVIAILTKPIVEYQSNESTGQEYVMRSLCTTKALPLSLTITIPKLEQPNIISGVAAGAINLREVNGQSGTAIIFYMEHNEEYQINELQELLNQLNFGPVESQPKNTMLNSNLYI